MEKLQPEISKESQEELGTRYRTILNLDDGRSVADTAQVLGVTESTMRRVRKRFLEQREALAWWIDAKTTE